MRVCIVIVAVALTATAHADSSSYANLDSIPYGDLVFVGGTDRTEYAYLDTIRVIFYVENPTTAGYFLFPFMFCTGAGLGEWWCPSPESPDSECVPVAHDDRICDVPEPVRPRVVEILPGRKVFYDAEVPPFHDFVIPRDWCFRRGYVIFNSPYQPPYWQLTVPYVRRGSTHVEIVSWSVIKQLYR